MIFINISNILSIKFLTTIRFCFWYCALLLCALTRTLFIIQTWSNFFILILILNLIFSIINLFIYKHGEYYQKLKYILVIFLSILTISTLITYIIYMSNIYYRIMNLVTINIMTADRNQSLLSTTLIHYQCCRIQEEILFDSVNERDYFLVFPFCEKVIIENEKRQDLWDNITTCGSLFRSIIFYIRMVFILDLILNITLLIQSLIYVCKDSYDEWFEDDPCTLLRPTNINYKIK